MAKSPARFLALSALRTWRTGHRRADHIFAELSREASLPTIDRAFALELFYGTLRHLTLLDFWIQKLRSTEIEPALRDLIRLGLYQLFLADVSTHAAVFETVELAPKHARGLVNAVLREASRQTTDLKSTSEKAPLAVRTSHPLFLVERWRAEFGEAETARLCRWDNEPPKIYARLNRLRGSDESFLRHHPDVQRVAGIPNFVELTGAFPSDALEKGDCYIQDPSTRLAVEQLDPKPGESILDACAAPGGKTAFIAETMSNRGSIVAVDRAAERIETLQENLDRLGVSIAEVVHHDWMEGPMSESLRARRFDRILVDAPCSNTGVMRRRVDVRWRLRPDEFDRMQEQQIAIMRSVLPSLKENGTIVYSTCSLEPEENRGVVQALADAPWHLELLTEKTSLPFRDGFDGAYVAKLRRRFP